LLTVFAACQDATSPQLDFTPQFAQGDNGIWTVNTLDDPGDGVCDDTECTLREAITDAAPGDHIVFASGLEGEVGLTASNLEIRKDLSIDGAGRIEVSGQAVNRVLFVGSGSDLIPAPTVMLAGLSFREGHAPVGGGLSGGGIIASHVNLTLDGVTLSGNRAESRGGAIYFANGEMTIRNSTITNNRANVEGGGVYVESGSTLTLINSTIARNSAASHGGAGIYLNESSSEITSSTISGNEGFGIYNRFGSVLVRSSVVTMNDGAGLGDGGLGVETATDKPAVTSLANTIFGGNGSTDCARSSAGGTPRIVSLGHNLGNIGCFEAPAAGDLDIVTETQLFSEVLEAELKDNGGPTQTHALIARGRAVDAGYCPGESADQRGFSRPVDDPVMPNALDGCDIGPYELQGPVGAVADLMVSQAVDKTSVKQGELLTYFVRVQNLGPDDAANVVVNDVLSSGVTFVEARGNKGSFTAPPRGETGTVTWIVGDLLDQGNEVAEIQVTVLVKGKTTVTSTATVTGDVADPNEANNSAAITVSVAAGSSKGGSRK
jgi:uncharacterized repeat protein (TIGR01451 family)/CSLREA domain-containing protein